MSFKNKDIYNKQLTYERPYREPASVPNLKSAMLSNRGLIKNQPIFPSLTKERRKNNIIDLKLNYPTQGFKKDSKFYKFMFAHPAEEGIFGMAGLGHPKTGLEANVGGFAPYDAIKNPYFKGDYFARIKKNFPKFSVGASTNMPISGYPDEAGKFTMNKIKPAVSLNFGMNLREGGDMVSTMGYRDDSPFRNSKSLNIYSPDGWIDMTNVSQRINANGVILEPNSGLNLVPPDENGVVKEELLIKKFGGNIHQTDPNMSTPGFYNRPILPVSQEGIPKTQFKRIPFELDYQQLGPQEATWRLPGPYADSELKSQEQFISDEFNRAGEVAKPYTVEFKEAVVYPTDELKRKQEKLLKNYESNFQKLWNYNTHADIGVPKSNRIQDLEDWNKKATKTIKENDKLSNRIKEDVGKLQKQLGYENSQDVLSAQGLADFRNLYKEGKISYSNFMDNYNNYLKFYDPNLVTLSAEDQKQLENIWRGPIDEQGRRTWMSDPMNVAKVAEEVGYWAPLTAAGLALAPLNLAGAAGEAVFPGIQTALNAPLQIGSKTIPGFTMANALDAYGIASMPFLAKESYDAFSEGDWQTGLTKAGETAFMGLGLRNPNLWPNRNIKTPTKTKEADFAIEDAKIPIDKNITKGLEFLDKERAWHKMSDLDETTIEWLTNMEKQTPGFIKKWYDHNYTFPSTYGYKDDVFFGKSKWLPDSKPEIGDFTFKPLSPGWQAMQDAQLRLRGITGPEFAKSINFPSAMKDDFINLTKKHGFGSEEVLDKMIEKHGADKTLSFVFKNQEEAQRLGNSGFYGTFKPYERGRLQFDIEDLPMMQGDMSPILKHNIFGSPNPRLKQAVDQYNKLVEMGFDRNSPQLKKVLDRIRNIERKSFDHPKSPWNNPVENPFSSGKESGWNPFSKKEINIENPLRFNIYGGKI